MGPAALQTTPICGGDPRGRRRPRSTWTYARNTWISSSCFRDGGGTAHFIRFDFAGQHQPKTAVGAQGQAIGQSVRDGIIEAAQDHGSVDGSQKNARYIAAKLVVSEGIQVVLRQSMIGIHHHEYARHRNGI